MIPLNMKDKRDYRIGARHFDKETGAAVLVFDPGDYDTTGKTITVSFSPAAVEAGPYTVEDGKISVPLFASMFHVGLNKIQVNFRKGSTLEQSGVFTWDVDASLLTTGTDPETVDVITELIADIVEVRDRTESVVAEVERKLIAGEFVGPQGEPGPQGERGETGERGEKGEQGEPGPFELLIDDTQTRTDRTWSSAKYQEELDAISLGTAIIDDDSVLDTKTWSAEKLALHVEPITQEEGRHGIRYYNNALQVYFAGEWRNVTTPGGSGASIELMPVKNLNGVAIIAGAELTWEDPADSILYDENGVDILVKATWVKTRIVRKAGSAPVDENDGVVVVESSVRDQYKDAPFVDTPLQNGVEYFYKAFPQQDAGRYTVDGAPVVSLVPIPLVSNPIYGVRINTLDSNPSTAVTYIEAAEGMQPAAGNNGNFLWGDWESVIKTEFGIKPVILRNLGGGLAAEEYTLQHDDFTKQLDGSTVSLSPSFGDVMISFPEPIHYKIEKIGTNIEIRISRASFPGSVNYVNELQGGYHVAHYYHYEVLRMLFILMFKSLNSQTALGVGTTSAIRTGVTDTQKFCYGRTTNSFAVKFLGLESLWGDFGSEMMEGVYVSDGTDVFIAKENYGVANGYTDTGLKLPAGTTLFMKEPHATNEVPFLAAVAGGSQTTYYCDKTTATSTTWRVQSILRLGRNNGGLDIGLFGIFDSIDDNTKGRLSYVDPETGAFYLGVYRSSEVFSNGSNKMRSRSGVNYTASKVPKDFRIQSEANNGGV